MCMFCSSEQARTQIFCNGPLFEGRATKISLNTSNSSHHALGDDASTWLRSSEHWLVCSCPLENMLPASPTPRAVFPRAVRGTQVRAWAECGQHWKQEPADLKPQWILQEPNDDPGWPSLGWPFQRGQAASSRPEAECLLSPRWSVASHCLG